MPIGKTAVVGAGLMGGAIAAHIANSGHKAVLLDIVPEGGGNRNALAEGAVARMLKDDPAPFMERSDAKRIATGNIDDHLDLLADADWIVEAVTEKVAVKQEVYRRIDSVRRTGAIVSSNTSTIPWRVLADGMPEAFARDFLITHFFNPPRYMRLLEVVAGPATRGDAAAAVADFADRKLGKSVVACNDTPGFIANRIGTYWLIAAIGAALDGAVTVEEADALMGRPMGIPKTGVFGLIDLVGLDLMPLVGRSLRDALPADDPLRAVYGEPEIVRSMIAGGYTGRKGKGGFYRLDPDSGAREKQVIDLRSGEYGPALRPRLESIEQAGRSLRALFEFPDRTGEYAWRVMSGTLAYAAGLVPEIADDVEAVDRAMRLGYNWKRGPFELIDEAGPAWFAGRLEGEGRAVPPLLRAAADAGGFYRTGDGGREHLAGAGKYAPVARPPGVLLLSDVKLAGPRLAGNGSASLWDLGDGVACLEFHSKMNALDPDIMALIGESVEIVGSGMKALVIHNEGHQLFGRDESRPCPVRPQCRRLADDRGDAEGGPGRLQRAQVRALPGGRRAVRHGARGRLRSPAALRFRAGARGMLYRAGRGGRRDRPGLGRLQGDDAARARREGSRVPAARWWRYPRRSRPSASPRCRARRRRRGSSASCATATASAPTATACWRMPRPGRWRWPRTTPRPSPRRSGCRARPGASRSRWRSRGSPGPARRRPTTSWWWTIWGRC